MIRSILHHYFFYIIFTKDPSERFISYLVENVNHLRTKCPSQFLILKKPCT